MGKIIHSIYTIVYALTVIYYYSSFDPNDEEVQSDGDDDDEVNENDSEDEGV